jgi:protein-disulfide isomerase-like protein with CxxC motif
MKTKINHAQVIVDSMFARAALYFAGFISESENEKIFSRIRKYQDKHRVNGSEVEKLLNS